MFVVKQVPVCNFILSTFVYSLFTLETMEANPCQKSRLANNVYFNYNVYFFLNTAM